MTSEWMLDLVGKHVNPTGGKVDAGAAPAWPRSPSETRTMRADIDPILKVNFSIHWLLLLLGIDGGRLSRLRQPVWNPSYVYGHSTNCLGQALKLADA